MRTRRSVIGAVVGVMVVIAGVAVGITALSDGDEPAAISAVEGSGPTVGTGGVALTMQQLQGIWYEDEGTGIWPDPVMARFDADGTFALLRLVAPSPDGEPIRGRVPRRTLAADADHERLIEQLVAARLVTSDDEVVQLAHEALARAWPRLRGWLEDDVDGQRILRHVTASAEAWDAMGRPDSELYRGIRLTQASTGGPAPAPTSPRPNATSWTAPAGRPSRRPAAIGTVPAAGVPSPPG